MRSVKYYCSGKVLMFVCVQLFILYFVVKSRNYIDIPYVCKYKDTIISELQKDVNQLQTKVDLLEGKTSKIRENTTSNKNTSSSASTVFLPRPEKHQLANDPTLFAELVTIILYKQSTTALSSLQASKKSLHQLFPKATILSASNTSTIGSTFNLLIQRVNTKYFLFLDSQHELFHQTSDHSSGWLLHALENIPELDFVSGSMLNHDQLEIPCYRLLLCNWTLSQRYEYQRSIDELMICENIAPSFMGRKSSIGRIFTNQNLIFDEKMTLLSTTDFFLRAKKNGALSGVRPEVMFKVRKDNNYNSTSVTMDRRDYFLALLPFAHKHKVFRFKHADSETLDLCGSDSPLLGEDICDEPITHKIMMGGGHWAYEGTFAYPFIIRNLQNCLFAVADFLTSQGIHFAIDAGVALGAVKMRGVLPWDSGDIDMLVYYESREKFYAIFSKFVSDHNFTSFNTHPEAIEFFCFPPNLGRKVGGIVTIFVHTEKIPDLIQIKTDGRWISYKKAVFRYLRNDYKLNYLQHKGHRSNELMYCKKKDHNACLPDFRKLEKIGKTGTFREFFCGS